MKPINNTCVEVLPALLDKSKRCTIRKAWHDSFSKRQGITQDTWPKEAAYKVGDIVPVIWKEEEDTQTFCQKCGVGKPLCDCIALEFNKHLGNVEITEVFKINAYRKDGINCLKGMGLKYTPYELAKMDGFPDQSAMFNYLHLNYDLSTPKDFWVYKWKWETKRKYPYEELNG